MKLIKEIRDNAAILTLKGEFDSFVCNPFVEEIRSILKNNIKFLIVDLRLVLFINSTAIGTLVKLHKEAKKAHGRMVLCRPSNFVNDVLDSLGLKEVFTIAEDPEAALAALGADSDGMDMGGDNSVILTLPEGKDKCVGKISALEEKYIMINLSDPKKDLVLGSACKVKFRLPLFRKGHYFEAGVVIEEAAHTETNSVIKCAFKDMKEEDRKSIAQFVEEMKFLRAEARKGK